MIPKLKRISPGVIAGSTQTGAVVPVDCRSWPVVPAAVNPVVLVADWYGITPAEPPTNAVAVVAAGAAAHVNAVPFQLRICPGVTGAVM